MKPATALNNERLILRQEEAIQKYDLLTNAILRIDGSRHVWVNARPLDLHGKERTLIIVLAEYTRANPGMFLPTEGVLRMIEVHNQRLKESGLGWLASEPSEIYSAFSKIRKELERSKVDRGLLERVNGKGYRLSTPAINIVIEEPHEAGIPWPAQTAKHASLAVVMDDSP